MDRWKRNTVSGQPCLCLGLSIPIANMDSYHLDAVTREPVPHIHKTRNLRVTVASTSREETQKDHLARVIGKRKSPTVDKVGSSEIRSWITYAWHFSLLFCSFLYSLRIAD